MQSHVCQLTAFDFVCRSLQAHLNMDLGTLQKGLAERAAALQSYRALGRDQLQIVMRAAFCPVSCP